MKRAIALGVAMIALAVPSARAAEGFVDVGRYGPAAGQTTEQGKRIQTLHAYNGKVYIGYGDGSANSGPIEVGYLEPHSGGFTEVFSAPTELVLKFRTIGDKLVMPYADPQNPWESLDDRFAVGDADTWTSSGGFAAIHVYDVIQGSDGSLFMSGSNYETGCNPETGCGRIWRSRDGGHTWEISFREELFSPVTYRCTGLGRLGDQLFAGCTLGYWTLVGDVWRPALLDPATRKLTHPLGPAATLLTNAAQIGGELVYSDVWTNISAGSGVWAYDGAIARTLYTGMVLDVAVANGSVFILGDLGTVLRINDVNSPDPEVIAHAGQDATALAVLGDDLYAGDAHAMISTCKDCARR